MPCFPGCPRQEPCVLWLRASLAFLPSLLFQGLGDVLAGDCEQGQPHLAREPGIIQFPTVSPCHLQCLLFGYVYLLQPVHSGPCPPCPLHSTLSDVFITDPRAVTVWLIKPAALRSTHAVNSESRKQKSKLFSPLSVIF